MSLQRITSFIEKDIAERGLKVGDPYLTAEDLGKIVGVSRATADRAMKALSIRHVLMRRQRSGTFVGPRAMTTERKRTGIGVIHLVGDRGALDRAPVRVERLLRELGDVHPDAVLDVHVPPPAVRSLYAQKLILRIAAAGDVRQALVLFGADEVEAAILENSGLASVLIGTECPPTTLPRIVGERPGDGTAAIVETLASRFVDFITRALTGEIPETERVFDIRKISLDDPSSGAGESNESGIRT